MNQPIIAVDMDEVLIGYNRQKIIPALRAAGYDVSYEDITSFHYEDVLGHEASKIALAIINHEEIYDGLEPEEGAMMGVDALRGIGRVIVVTHSLPRMATAKIEWLLAHDFLEEDIVMTKDKRMVQADLLIDDALHHIEPWVATGRPAVLFDRPWNRGWTREDLAPRVRSWADISATVETLLRQRERPETVLEEAARIVDRGARQQDYGHPTENYRALAAMANALLSRKLRQPIDSMDTVRLMTALKLVRDAARSKRDNWTDVAGYARVAERVAAGENLWNEKAAS